MPPIAYRLFILFVLPLALFGCGRGPLYERGEAALRQGEYVAARAMLEKAISQRPGGSNTARAHNLAGVACWRLGETEAARDAFEASREIDPSLAAAAYNLGVLNAAAGNVTQAATLFHEAALLDTADPRPLEYVARLEADQGRWSAAAAALTEALKRAPLSPRVLTALALAEAHTQGAAEAMSRLGAAIDAEPDYGPAYLNLAVLAARELKDEAEAVVWLDKYLALEGDDVELRERIEAWRETLKARLPDEGDTAEREGVRIEPVPLGAAGERGGTDREQQRQMDRRRAAVAAYNRGTVAYAKRAWEEAITAYRDALEQDPSLMQARMHLGMALHAAGKDRDAVVELQQVVSREPGNARAHYMLGLIFGGQRQTRPEAIRHYRKYLELQPNDPSAPRIRAWLEDAGS